MLKHLLTSARNGLRAVGWNWIGPAVALTVIAIAFAVLFHVLRGIAIEEVFTAFTEIPGRNLVRAAVCVALAYTTLTLYDWFALRTLGKTHIPYPIAAMASFTSYSIGHNIGATAFSAGAIRYRIYSSKGLTAIDVAKVCFVTGLTFWLGNFGVLGMAMVYDPAAVSGINQIAPAANRAIGIGLLGSLAGYVGWVWTRPRRIGWKAFELMLPSGRSTLFQIGIGITDLTFCSLAMFMLVPAVPVVPFITVAGVFVAATLLGFASHAPGSLGVFDAAMLVALPVFDKEELVAALLVFRLMYFVTPFACALVIMGTREAVMGLRRRADASQDAKAGAP